MSHTRLNEVTGSNYRGFILRSASRFAPLSNNESAMLEDAIERPEQLAAGSELVKEGEAKPRASVLLSGWAGKQRLLADGRRQIFTFIVPGDVVGLTPFGQPLASTVALTPVVVAQVPFLQDAAVDGSGALIGLATFARAMMEREARYLLNHIVRIGRQTAYERMIDLMLELQSRLEEVGLAAGAGFPLPLTQETLADSLGLSIVHVNRTLQQLRRDRALVLRDSMATLLEPNLAAGRSEFTPRRLRDAARALS